MLSQKSQTTLYDCKTSIRILRSNLGELVLADLPGLIKGASKGTGLGLRFLAHIERCKAIIHLCDLSVESDAKFIENYKMIRKEILSYDKEVSKKKEIILLSKCDLATDKVIQKGLTCLKNLLVLKSTLYQVIKNIGLEN